MATPHLGASTEEAQENVAIQVAEQMADFLLTGAVTNALNMPSVSAEDAPRLKPYMKLAEQLGSFAGQVTETGIRRAVIEFEGHVAALNTKPLVQAAIAGLLKPFSDAVNMVSAPVIARERGIEISEVKHDRPGDYQTLIKLTVESERFTRSVSGTLFGGDKPRIVDIKGIQVEAPFSNSMLYITNQDKPGLIGALGTLFSTHGVNIASFHLGRTEAGGDAIALVELDSDLSDSVLQEISALPLVTQAKRVNF